MAAVALSAVLSPGTAALLVASLAAAVAAAAASATAGSALGVLARVQDRERDCVRSIGLGVAAPLAAIHVLAVAVAVVVAWRFGLSGTPPLAAGLPALLTVPSFALCGALLGWRMRSVAAAPVAAALAFGVLVIVSDAAPTQLLDVTVGGDTGVHFSPRASGVAASAAAIALIGVIAVAAAPSRTRRRSAAAVACATLAFVAIVAFGPDDALRERQGATVCTGAAPQVCGFAERRKLLEPTRRQLVALQAAVDRLATGDAHWPARWAEAGRPDARTGRLTVANPEDHAGLAADVLAALTRCGSSLLDDRVLRWLVLTVYGPRDPALATLATGVPPPRLAPDRLRAHARRSLIATRRSRCA